MSVRHSEYELLPGDSYYTPAWVTHALMNVEKFPEVIWEPACGAGHMVDVLTEYYPAGVYQSDRVHRDFLCDLRGQNKWPPSGVKSIITNPPYSNGLAEAFVRRALYYTHFDAGKVAMLLPLAWDSAKTRRDLFSEHPAFKAKYTLTQRIRWENLEQKKNGPSQNHAWFVWDWANENRPVCGYLPATGAQG